MIKIIFQDLFTKIIHSFEADELLGMYFLREALPALAKSLYNAII